MGSLRSFASVVLLALIGMIVFSGCSSFRSSRKMDIAPFSENTGVMFAEAAKVNRPFPFKQLRPYTDLPVFQDARVRGEPLLRALRSVVYYSNQVVAIGNSKLSAKDKNRQLARYLSDVMETATEKTALDSLGLDEASVRSVLENIRNAETYLDGIAAAGPVVNAVVMAIQNKLDEFQQTLVPAVVAALDGEIQADFADIRANYTDLKTLQARSMRAVNLLYRGRMGDREALGALLNEDPSVKEFLSSPEKATGKEMDAAERYLLDRLAKIDTVIHQLDQDLAVYTAKQDELGAMRIDIDEKVKIARNAVTVWAQSHRNLGAGIPVPPMIDVSGIAGSLVGKAQKAVF